jgi:large subunit ribosomal protein L6
MVEGVSQGYSKNLEIVGVGYRAQVQGKVLTLNVGYSKPVEMEMPEGITAAMGEKNTQVIISGIDKEVVGDIAAKVRAVRPPEPYKGKGIRYQGEYIRRKAGKTGKK